MWLSKKKYNEMMGRIERLENCHSYSYEIDRSVNPFKEVFPVFVKKYNHVLMVNTEKIKNITFQELASYVIDHKPIERNEKIEVAKKYY